MIPLRLYIYAAIAFAFMGVLWHDHHQTHRANRLAVKANQLQADLTAERANTEKANAAAERYAISVENLKAARADTPARAVRLCGPTVVREARAASRTDAPGSEGLQEAPRQHPRDRWSDDGPDIGGELYALADEADLCPAQLEALQGWVRNR